MTCFFPATLASLGITLPSFTTNHKGRTFSVLCSGYAFSCLKALTQAKIPSNRKVLIFAL